MPPIALARSSFPRFRVDALKSPFSVRSLASQDDVTPPTRPGLNLLGRAVHVDDVINRRPDDILASLASTSSPTRDRAIERLDVLLPSLARRRARGEVSIDRCRELARDARRASKNIVRVKHMFHFDSAIDAADVCARELALVDMDESGVARARLRVEEFRELLGASAGDAFCAAAPRTLVADDVSDVKRRVRALREAIPNGDMKAICSKSPSVLMDDDALELARRAAATLREAMPRDAKVDLMLSDFPSLLSVDIASLLEDIERVFGKDPCDVLRRNPKISYQVSERNERSFATVDRARRVLAHRTIASSFEKNSGIFRPLR